MFMNFMIVLILLILLLEAYVIFSLIKIIKNFLSEIHSIKGIQFGLVMPGDMAPLFRATDHRNSKVVLNDLLIDKEVNILFVSNTCAICREVLKELNQIFNNNKSHTIIILQEEMSQDIPLYDFANLSYLVAPHIFTSYKITKTPYLYFIDKSGKVSFSTEISSAKHLKKLTVLDQAV